jgi:hypothetical protein
VVVTDAINVAVEDGDDPERVGSLTNQRAPEVPAPGLVIAR